MKRMCIAGVLALAVVTLAAGPASAAAGGNSDNAKLCQKGGWVKLFRSDGSRFANQGDCASYGAHGNTILIEPNAWQAACEQAGGTFSISDKDVFGRALTPPAFAYVCTPVTEQSYVDTLRGTCTSYPDWDLSLWFGRPDGPGTAECVRKGTT
jgi:hypothetical protein